MGELWSGRPAPRPYWAPGQIGPAVPEAGASELRGCRSAWEERPAGGNGQPGVDSARTRAGGGAGGPLRPPGQSRGFRLAPLMPCAPGPGRRPRSGARSSHRDGRDVMGPRGCTWRRRRAACPCGWRPGPGVGLESTPLPPGPRTGPGVRRPRPGLAPRVGSLSPGTAGSPPSP